MVLLSQNRCELKKQIAYHSLSIEKMVLRLIILNPK